MQLIIYLYDLMTTWSTTIEDERRKL